MYYNILDFGRYAGKSLPQIILHDPDWFFWALESGVFDGQRLPTEQVQWLGHCARNIQIPDGSKGPRIALYSLHEPTGKFLDVQFAYACDVTDTVPNGFLVRPVIDLSVPRTIAAYDKTGGKRLLRSVRRMMFGQERIYLTRERCESFFNNESNFVMRRQRVNHV
jgi:hypothetical protein